MNPTTHPLMSDKLSKQITDELAGVNVFDTDALTSAISKAILKLSGNPDKSFEAIVNKDLVNRIRFQIAMAQAGHYIEPIKPYTTDLTEIDSRAISLPEKCYMVGWDDIKHCCTGAYFLGTKHRNIEVLVVLPGPLNFYYVTIKLRPGRYINSILEVLSMLIRKDEKFLSQNEINNAYIQISRASDSLEGVNLFEGTGSTYIISVIRVIAEVLRRVSSCITQQLTPIQPTRSQSE